MLSFFPPGSQGSLKSCLVWKGLWAEPDLDLWGDEQRRDADELQIVFVHVLLRQHEAVKEILSQIRRLSVETVHLTHLKDTEEPSFHCCWNSGLRLWNRPLPPGASRAGWPSSWAEVWDGAAGSSCRGRTSALCSTFWSKRRPNSPNWTKNTLF